MFLFAWSYILPGYGIPFSQKLDGEKGTQEKNFIVPRHAQFSLKRLYFWYCLYIHQQAILILKLQANIVLILMLIKSCFLKLYSSEPNPNEMLSSTMLASFTLDNIDFPSACYTRKIMFCPSTSSCNGHPAYIQEIFKVVKVGHF